MLSILLVLTLVGVAQTCPDLENSTQPLTQLWRRWYGVRPWIGGERFPDRWPHRSADYVPITYCYKAASDYDYLHTRIEGGIAVWQEVFDQTAVKFIPAHKEAKTLCSGPGVREDTVRILDVTATAGATQATTGYSWTNKALNDVDRAAGRKPRFNDAEAAKPYPLEEGQENLHELHFFREDEDAGEYTDLGWDTWKAAHEIGHILGLGHEHQRPDARKHIGFDCSQIGGYDQMKDAIARGQQGKKVPGFEQGDTVQKACTEQSVALRYSDHGFNIEGWLPDLTKIAIGNWEHSEPFDFQSIMLYPSYLHKRWRSRLLGSQPKDAEFPDQAVIWQIDPTAPGGKKEILPGGLRVDTFMREYDVSDIKVSEGDAARVAQLYPKKETPDDLKGEEKWKPNPIVIPGASGERSKRWWVF